MAAEASKQRVLIVGGSGYLGQFLLNGIAQGEPGSTLSYTFSSRPLAAAPEGTAAFQVHLSTGQGLHEALARGVDVVINCAAISQPVACERDPAAARAVNVPTRLLDGLEQQARGANQHQGGPLLIHLSTDQVYDGSRAKWHEGDACEPINEYGRSKLEAERAVQAWRGGSTVILRSSIIYGPLPPEPVPRALFLQFVDDVVTRRQPTSFFEDEWRCPIFVQDIVQVVLALMCQNRQRVAAACGFNRCLVLNMGGPERLSRVDMARLVATFRGLSDEDAGAVIKPCKAASVARGVASPADISMDSRLLTRHTGVHTTRLVDALPSCLPPVTSSPP